MESNESTTLISNHDKRKASGEFPDEPLSPKHIKLSNKEHEEPESCIIVEILPSSESQLKCNEVQIEKITVPDLPPEEADNSNGECQLQVPPAHTSISDAESKNDKNKDAYQEQNNQCTKIKDKNDEFIEADILPLEALDTKSESLQLSDETQTPGYEEDGDTNQDDQIEESGDYLYRLLRGGENINIGLSPKDRSSSVGVVEHVADGNKESPSKYISTCKTLSEVQRFRSLKRRSKRYRHGVMTIVRIDVGRMKQDGIGFRLIDLTDTCERDFHISWFHRKYGLVHNYKKYSSAFNEVLIELYEKQTNIPPGYLKTVDD